MLQPMLFQMTVSAIAGIAHWLSVIQGSAAGCPTRKIQFSNQTAVRTNFQASAAAQWSKLPLG